MKPEAIKTDKAPMPGGWYSQGFVVGDFIFTAGITANDPVTGKLTGPGDIRLQTRQVLENMKALLEGAGSDMEHVFKTLVFVSDISQFDVFNEEYKKYFPGDPPARSTMQVGKFNGDMVIEIEAIAVKKDGDYGNK